MALHSRSVEWLNARCAHSRDFNLAMPPSEAPIEECQQQRHRHHKKSSASKRRHTQTTIIVKHSNPSDLSQKYIIRYVVRRLLLLLLLLLCELWNLLGSKFPRCCTCPLQRNGDGLLFVVSTFFSLSLFFFVCLPVRIITSYLCTLGSQPGRKEWERMIREIWECQEIECVWECQKYSSFFFLLACFFFFLLAIDLNSFSFIVWNLMFENSSSSSFFLVLSSS